MSQFLEYLRSVNSIRQINNIIRAQIASYNEDHHWYQPQSTPLVRNRVTVDEEISIADATDIYFKDGVYHWTPRDCLLFSGADLKLHKIRVQDVVEGDLKYLACGHFVTQSTTECPCCANDPGFYFNRSAKRSHTKIFGLTEATEKGMPIIGIELECCFTNSTVHRERHDQFQRYLIQLQKKYPGVHMREWEIVSDGSLHGCGSEFVSAPMTYQYFMEHLPRFTKVFNGLLSFYGATDKDTRDKSVAGIHIHVSFNGSEFVWTHDISTLFNELQAISGRSQDAFNAWCWTNYPYVRDSRNRDRECRGFSTACILDEDGPHFESIIHMIHHSISLIGMGLQEETITVPTILMHAGLVEQMPLLFKKSYNEMYAKQLTILKSPVAACKSDIVTWCNGWYDVTVNDQLYRATFDSYPLQGNTSSVVFYSDGTYQDMACVATRLGQLLVNGATPFTIHTPDGRLLIDFKPEIIEQKVEVLSPLVLSVVEYLKQYHRPYTPEDPYTCDVTTDIIRQTPTFSLTIEET